MINSVRNTVLSVLNKNNYGYISPSDFNLYAKQAQMELYDEYFSNYNKVITMENARASGTSYADIQKAISETIEYFLTTSYLHPFNYDFSEITRNRFYVPSFITTGDEAYMVERIVCYPNKLTDGVNDNVLINYLRDSTASFLGLVFPGDIVVNWTTIKTATVYAVPSDTTIQLSADIFNNPGDDYYIISTRTKSEPEKVTATKIGMLNASNLTAPSNIYPAVTQEGPLYQIYPISSTFNIGLLGQLQATYFRYPRDPKWTYLSLGSGEPVFDQSQPDYQDFEMPSEDEYKLSMKILQYCGISIRESEVTQFAMAQEQHEQPTFSQQQ
jgi:hypothetical protein